jgi:type I restriction enzyme S subunit
MDTVILKEYVRIKTGKLDANASEENGIYPFFTCAREISKINVFAFDCECVLVAGNGELNVKYYEGKFNAYQRTYVIESIDKSVLSVKYLYYFIDSYIEKLRNGAIGGVIKYIKLNHLTDIEFPLPDIETQNKIVAILDKAKTILEKRQKTIAKYDALLESNFLNLFGDPISNTKFWPTDDLEMIAKLERGRFSPRPRNDPSYFDGKFPFIQTGDIANSNYRLTKYSQTLNEKGIAVSKKFDKGVIVIAIVGATIGATSILEIDVYATDSIIGIKPKQNIVNNVFLEMLLRFQKKILIDSAPEAARANINLSIIGNIKCIVPPIDLQEKYFKISNLIYSNKSKLLHSEKEIANLIASLSSKAFKGELDFNTAVDLEVLLENDYDFFKEHSSIKSIQLLLERLDKDELNENKFYEQPIYDKAKGFVFELLKEGKVKQVFDEKTKRVKLTV